MTTTINTTNTEIIQRAYADFARGDLPAVLAVFDPDLQWIEALGGPYGGCYSGPQAVVENVFGRFGADWENLSVIPDRLIADGDTVVAIGTYEGTCRATGRHMQARFAHLWQLHKERITQFEQFADTSMILAAMA